MDEGEEVEAERRRETAEQRAREEQGVLVALVSAGQVVVVEHPDLEDGVVGAEAEVADREEADQLDGEVVVLGLGQVDKHREERERRVDAEERDLEEKRSRRYFRSL